MDVYNWAAVPEEKLNDRMSRWVIHLPCLTVARLWLEKGAVVPLHSHPNEQMSMVKSGALEFEFFPVGKPAEKLILRPGEVLRIAGDLPHRVEALEETSATDVFCPAREDWIRGDDAYLRQPV